MSIEPVEILTNGLESPERILFLIPGYGDRPERFLSRLVMIDPEMQWLVASPVPRLELEDGTTCWYTVDEDGPSLDEVAASVGAIDAAVAALLAETGLDESQLVLGGFSQGGALALATALDPTVSFTPRAVAALAPYLLHRDQLDPARVAGRPALVVHGRHDDHVEQTRGRAAAKYLERSGADVTWLDVEGGHHLGPVLLGPLGDWLQQFTPRSSD